MCCGRPMHALVPQAMAPQVRASAAPLTATARPNPVRFEYTGRTALTVVSPLTGRKYRFAEPGAKVEVDARDRSWIAFVPHVRRAV